MSDLGSKDTMAKNIQHYLDINGKTRNDICNDLGFKYTTFSDWVNGKTYPRIDKIESMANYFGIQKSDLVEEKLQETEMERLLATISMRNDDEVTIRLLRYLTLLNKSQKELLANIASEIIKKNE